MGANNCESNGSPASRESEISISLLEEARKYLIALSCGKTPSVSSARFWEEFYGKVHPLLLRFATACRVPDSDTDDCVQQVWHELVVKLRDFEYDPHRGQFRTWLYTLVHSRATDLTRRAARRRTTGLPDDPNSHPLDPAPGPPARCYSRARLEEILTRLRSLQDLLSQPNSQILQMRWIDGCSISEVAEALDLTADQVRFRSHRLRQKFREAVDDASP